MIWTQLYIYSRKLCHFITILYFRYVARVSTDACALNMLGILLERQRHFRTAKRFTVADFFIWNPLKNSRLYSLALKNFIGFLKYSWCLVAGKTFHFISLGARWSVQFRGCQISMQGPQLCAVLSFLKIRRGDFQNSLFKV